MFKHIRPIWEEINLDNLAHNMREIRRISNAQEIFPAIKADAYGHGAIESANVLLENGADGFSVAVISEAVELRKAGIGAPILILGFTSPTLINEVIKYDIQQTVYSLDYAKTLSEAANEKNKIIKIHICIDTGMGRIGFLPDDKSIEDVYKISKLPNISIEGIFSHFSSADEFDKNYTYNQLNKFNEFYDNLIKKGLIIRRRHISNSASIIDLSNLDFEAVRPGIILYGYYPSIEVNKDKIDIKPVMELKTNVVHIKEVPKGSYIGYGRKYKTKKKSLIATLPVGYADGYTRMLFNKGKVIVKEEYAPVAGKICMDQCMIDVTHINDVKVGDEVVLIGRKNDKKIDADDIAEWIGTINYEVLCMISKRVPRIYYKNGEVIKVRNYI